MPTPRVPAEVKLFRLMCITSETGCWEWSGYYNPNGYPMITIDGLGSWAHRVSYETFEGPIPEGFQIDHICHNKGCINPDHLEAVSASENLRRRIRPSYCKRGHRYEDHGHKRPADGAVYCKICNHWKGES